MVRLMKMKMRMVRGSRTLRRIAMPRTKMSE
jgi:hypothetical protein